MQVIVSDRNNDRKFMFLSEETKPDYRPVNQRPDLKPSPKMDHRPLGADSYQRSISEPKKRLEQPDGHTATEKQLKTNLNLGTKFQEVQKKWSGGSLGQRTPDIELDLDNLYRTAAQSGSSSVRSLTSRFDYRDNKEAEEAAEALKRTVNEQVAL